MKPGSYVRIEERTEVLGETPLVGEVLITSLQERVDGRGKPYTYVGWRNRDRQGGWDPRLGYWGYFRLYPEPRPYGTRVLEVLRD